MVKAPPSDIATSPRRSPTHPNASGVSPQEEWSSRRHSVRGFAIRMPERADAPSVSSVSASPPTVTVGVVAYNEEHNIGAFLDSVLTQAQDGFRLMKVIVILDGCTDRTAAICRARAGGRVVIVEHTARAGKSGRLNELYSLCESDFLVQADADVLLGNKKVLAAIISPMLLNPRVALCGGAQLPLSARTFTERAVNSTVAAYLPFRRQLRGGHNIFSADGRLLALRKNFYRQLRIPADMIGNDHFAYFSCLALGYRYRHVDRAVVYFRSPQNLRDHCAQQVRFLSVPGRLRRYFGAALVDPAYAIPPGIFLKQVFTQFRKHPVLCAYIFVVNSYCRLKVRLCAPRPGAIWKIAESSKVLKS